MKDKDIVEATSEETIASTDNSKQENEDKEIKTLFQKMFGQRKNKKKSKDGEPKKDCAWIEVTWKKTGEDKEFCNRVFAFDEYHARRIIMQQFGKTYSFEVMMDRMKKNQSVEPNIDFIGFKTLDPEEPKKKKKKHNK